MWTPITIALKIASQAEPQSRDSGVVMHIDVIIFDSAPQALDEDIVQVTTTPIHTNTNASSQQASGKRMGGELRALVTVENVRLTESESAFQGTNAKLGIHRIRQLPCQYEAAKPIHDSNKIHRPTRHWDIGNVYTPHFIRLPDDAIPEQIRPNLVFWVAKRRFWSRKYRLDAHFLHQAQDSLAVDVIPFTLE